jgi:hypothetical protein
MMWDIKRNDMKIPLKRVPVDHVQEGEDAIGNG